MYQSWTGGEGGRGAISDSDQGGQLPHQRLNCQIKSKKSEGRWKTNE